MSGEHIGILGYDSFHFVVENLERSRQFYTTRFDFKEVARASDELVERSGQQSVVFGAGDVRVCVSTPLRQSSKAARYLSRHPAGVMSLSFAVKNLDETIAFLEARGGTFLADPFEDKDGKGHYRSVEIATPLGDVAFRFVERADYKRFAPGFIDSGVGNQSAPPNIYGIKRIDHVTANGLTMQPIVAWYRDVLGMQPFWDISFHTRDVKTREQQAGSGLRSIVMHDPVSHVKFATNEPLRPNFRDSQITKFVDDNGAAGIQHIAMAVDNIVWSIEELKRRGVDFMDTPKAYYQALPERLAKLGITNVKEEIKELERLQILVDGAEDKYMLQIFLREAKALHDDMRAGPFFYEVIQRCGDEGFGYGNFRALFESIERFQKTSADAT